MTDPSSSILGATDNGQQCVNRNLGCLIEVFLLPTKMTLVAGGCCFAIIEGKKVGVTCLTKKETRCYVVLDTTAVVLAVIASSKPLLLLACMRLMMMARGWNEPRRAPC